MEEEEILTEQENISQVYDTKKEGASSGATKGK